MLACLGEGADEETQQPDASVAAGDPLSLEGGGVHSPAFRQKASLLTVSLSSP